MLCQSCGKNEAEFHYHANINGELRQLHLCQECAAKLGGASPFKQPQANYFNTFLSDLLHASRKNTGDTRQCPLCGATERSIISTGKVGCAQCYETFSDMLAPYIKRIHGNPVHCGKVPASAGPEIRRRREIESLRHELDAAVKIEDFEKAVILRDKIKELEGSEPV
jgi:protein arginine kinase activator